MPRGERGELGRKRGAGRWRTVRTRSGKEGEPKASGAERAGNTAITVNHSKARRTRQVHGGYWTRSDEFFAYTILEKLHFHVALEEVRVTELLSY